MWDRERGVCKNRHAVKKAVDLGVKSFTHLELVPRDGRALLPAQGGTLDLDGRVAAHRLLRELETAHVEGRNGNLKRQVSPQEL